MENASKALLLAAAILIAIILISLGVYLVSQGQSTILQSSDALTDVEASAFNSKFEAHEGTRNGSNIKELIKKVSASNRTNPGQQVLIVADTGLVSSSEKKEGENTYTEYKATSKIGNNTRYTVDLEYNGGVVSKITIKTTATTQQ